MRKNLIANRKKLITRIRNLDRDRASLQLELDKVDAAISSGEKYYPAARKINEPYTIADSALTMLNETPVKLSSLRDSSRSWRKVIMLSASDREKLFDECGVQWEHRDIGNGKTSLFIWRYEF